MVNGFGFHRLAAFLLPAALLLGLSGAAEAQGETPIYEVSGGYAFLRDLDLETNFPSGWNVSIARNFTDSIGVVGDMGGNYKSLEGASLNIHTFLGGARYSFRRERLTPYAEALVGMARLGGSSGGLGASTWDFAVQGGVGLGYKIKENLALRGGFDYRSIFSEGTSTQELRALAGVSFSFGSRGGAVRAQRPASIEPPLPEAEPEPAPPETPAPAPLPGTRPLDEPPPPPAEVRRPRPPAPVAPTPGLLGRGQDSLRTGDYSGAADAFREYLQVHASYKFTIPVGAYCDAANIAQQVRIAEASPELFVLRRTLRGQMCYGLYWGLFASRPEAQRALRLLPSGLRAPGQAPISVSRLLASSLQ